MISGLLSAELSATCNALGYFSGSTYYTDPYVKETITDLIRFLRRDDDEHGIRRHLGEARLLQTDLIPIMVHHADKPDLFDVVLRLLVNLTNPALLVYQECVPADRAARHYFLQLIGHLQQYKQAFTEPRVWQVLSEKMTALLQIDYAERDEDQSRTLERILILVRNVLQAPADSEYQRPDNDASVHDQVLWSLHQARIVDLFLYIGSTDNEQQFYMHILEIVSLMLREQSPSVLASAALQRSVEEKEQDEKELLEIRKREVIEKQAKFKKYAGSRHSRFGGTFVVKNVKSISDRELVYHKPLSKAVSLSFDDEKQKIKVPKNKRALNHETSVRRSAFSVRLFLKEFCVEFLNGAYNPLMYKVRENLVRATGQPNDETYYFWAMKFFMEFNRLYKFQVKLISETMHQQIFHFVQTQMENWLEHMITDKKKIPIWTRRVHTALKAYQELLMTLQAMDTSEDESVRRSASVIKSNIFYQGEYRELLLFLFNVYADTKFSRQYLKDLVETTHIFMRMLERFCSKNQNLIVQGKARKKQKKKKKPSRATGGGANAEAVWSSLAAELSVVLESANSIPNDVVPFDAASDLTDQQHKVEAMKKIQAELKNGNFEQAVGLLRASREVWPENNCFGHADMPTDEEFLAMREIFMTDMGQPIEAILPGPDNEDDDSEEDEEDPRAIEIPEQTFNFKEFLMRFACPRVLSAVCSLLETFPSNSLHTNHCCVKLLHRVAWTCKMPAMLFQASLFRTFQRLYKSTSAEHKELQQYANFMMRKFAEMTKTNRKIFMELLFWKNAREANELEMGYGNVPDKQMKGFWREEQEDELRRLAAEYERDTPEPDAVGWIMKNMIDQTRSRRGVAKKLKELFLVVGHMKQAKPKSVKEFNEEQVNELKALFDQFKDAVDPMNCILGRMAVPRSRKTIVDKLLDLGLITDSKEMRKKKDKSERNRGADNWGQRSDDESIYDTSDEESDPEVAAKREKRRANVQPPPRSLAQIKCYLRRIVDAGMRDALHWLRESLHEALDDVTDEPDDEGTALLPLTPLAVQAMDNPSFQQLLDILAIDKPSDQEMYWRIPGRWMAEDFNKRITLIKDALEDNLPEISPEDEIAQDPGPSYKAPVKKKKQYRKSKKSLVEPARDEGSENSSDSANGSDENDEILSSHKIDKNNSSSSDEDSQGRRNIIANSEKKQDTESDSDKENDNLNFNKVSASSKQQQKLVKRKKITIESDSDNGDSQTSQTNDKKTNRVSSASDTEEEPNSSYAMSGEKNKGKPASKRRININSSSSDSEDLKNTTVNSTKASIASLSQKSRSRSNSSVKSKSHSSNSDSDNNKNSTLNSIKTSIASLSQESRRSRLNLSVKSKSRSSSSDSYSDKNSTVNSTKTSIASLSQESRRSRLSSSVKSKGRSSSSDSYSDKNTAVNSTKTSISSISQVSRRSRLNSSVKSKSRSSSSDSCSDKNATVNSTKTSIASLSQEGRSSRLNSSVKSKSRSSSSDSCSDKNTAVNSTKTSIASLRQEGRRSRLNSSVKSKSRSSSSDSDNNQNSTLNSTKTSIASLSQVSRRSRLNSSFRSKSRSSNSDSDNDKNTTVNSTRTSIASLSQESRTSRSNSSARSRKHSSYDSDTQNNSVLNSTKDTNTSVISEKLSNSKRKRFNIDSDPEDVDEPAALFTTTVTDEDENEKLTNRKKKCLMIGSDSDS